MNLKGIEVVYESQGFSVHQITIEEDILSRVTTPSTVGLILHDPVNDCLILEQIVDISEFSLNLQLPELPIGPDGPLKTAEDFLKSLGISTKGITYVQTVSADPRISSKQINILYVIIDSRTVPNGEFVKSTGTEVIKRMGTYNAIGAPLCIAALYLKLLRHMKA